ncbi:hypothetical protein M9H77_20763 [Catharanthus roseus]|uniref:Uncharacterized protein n=1 Tax=Catharanthus roseus TaxID=4058 RepID=A0ACC0AM34_CATRO|nr:hypothetical protein M9H77_20763 [Catharanthus roseus]
MTSKAQYLENPSSCALSLDQSTSDVTCSIERPTFRMTDASATIALYMREILEFQVLSLKGDPYFFDTIRPYPIMFAAPYLKLVQFHNSSQYFAIGEAYKVVNTHSARLPLVTAKETHWSFMSRTCKFTEDFQ